MNLPSTYVYTMPLPKYADRMYFISVKLHYKLPKLQLKLTSHFQENIPEITGLASTSQSRSTVPPMSTNTTSGFIRNVGASGGQTGDVTLQNVK